MARIRPRVQSRTLNRQAQNSGVAMVYDFATFRAERLQGRVDFSAGPRPKVTPCRANRLRSSEHVRLRRKPS